MIELNIQETLNFISNDEINSYSNKINEANDSLYNKTGKGNDFLGWLDLPSKTSGDLLKSINETADRLASISDIIVVIGIGGSYLGARAVIDALSGNFSQLQRSKERKSPLILYAGQNIGEDYHNDLLNVLNNYDYSLIVISKSGTTTEPAIAFRLLKKHIEEKYGKENVNKRIVTVTDKSKGALKRLSDSEGYSSFVIPDDVGGRFSVLTPVGLLPIASAGFNIGKLIDGAKEMEELCRLKKSINDTPANLYAAIRSILYNKGKVIEILASYTPNLNYLIEWWKQLYGESEGKNGKGIFPAGVSFTTDLHSIGQLIQDGMRNIFETVINVQQSNSTLTVPVDDKNLDDLNFLAGKRLSEINYKAQLGTSLAHVEGGVPNISITLPAVNENELGGLIYFFEKACAISGYLLDVNPFNQPGVEAYKKNMFKLMGKPGY
ncbi:MAG TPA: glucose-6-phosphate isomerase [Ignavibacteria bacterium]|nr:glucose-6-phosphate isomerase [Ignavibacteria bacterium]